MTSRAINRAIKHTGLIIKRGVGYQYFDDAITGDQVGESVYVCYLNQYTIEQWIEEAEYARKNDANDSGFADPML